MKSTKTRDRDPQWRPWAGRAGAVEQARAPAREVQREDRSACHSVTDGDEQVCVRAAVGCGGGGWQSILTSK